MRRGSADDLRTSFGEGGAPGDPATPRSPRFSPASPEAQQTKPRPVQPAANVLQPIVDVVWRGAGTIILLLVIITIAKIMLASKQGTNGKSRRRSAPTAAAPARHGDAAVRAGAGGSRLVAPGFPGMWLGD